MPSGETDSDAPARKGSRRDADDHSGGLQLQRLIDWIKLVATLSLPLYGVLWLAARVFYGRLGLDPRDVGLDQVSIITAASGQLLLLCLGAALYVWVFRAWWKDKGRMLFAGVAVVLVVWWSVLIALAVIRSHHVAEGRIETVSYAFIPIVPWDVWPTEVRVLSNGETNQLAYLEGDCVLYLGKAQGVTVLYDVSRHESVEVPSGSLLLELHTRSQGTPECAPFS